MRLPHVQPFAKSPLYFFTACTEQRRPLLACESSFALITEIWRNSAMHDGWLVGRFVLMPDHVHFFAMPAPDALPRASWHKLWKSVSSRRIAEALRIPPPIWQADTFDHILRNPGSYGEKWNYVRENPVRQGLVTRTEDWPWQGEINMLRF